MATDDFAGFAGVGAGSGGVEEMQAHVNDATVQYALLKFVFGSGSFARTKMIFLHINGENCSALKRGRFNTKKGEAKRIVGSTAAELIVEEKAEVTVDHILTELSKVIAHDEMGEFSISTMRADYERLMAQQKMRRMSVIGGGAGRKRKTAREMGTVPSHRAIEELRKPLGAFNWALFKGIKGGELDFVNAGSASIHELREELGRSSYVGFALLRMGFGAGRFRRTKYLYIVFSPEGVSPVKRGQAMAQESDMSKSLAPFSITVHASSLDELTLEAIIDKVRKATVVDGDDTESKTEDPFSVDAFMEALAEEQAANAEFFGDSGDAAEAEHAVVNMRKVIDDLHHHDGVHNWLLFEPLA